MFQESCVNLVRLLLISRLFCAFSIQHKRIWSRHGLFRANTNMSNHERLGAFIAYLRNQLSETQHHLRAVSDFKLRGESPNSVRPKSWLYWCLWSWSCLSRQSLLAPQRLWCWSYLLQWQTVRCWDLKDFWNYKMSPKPKAHILKGLMTCLKAEANRKWQRHRLCKHDSSALDNASSLLDSRELITCAVLQMGCKLKVIKSWLQ